MVVGAGQQRLTERHGAATHLLEPCQHAEHGGFSAAAGAQQRHEFAGGDIESDAIDCGVLAKLFGDAVEH